MARRPWAAVLQGPPEVTGDDMVAAMDTGDGGGRRQSTAVLVLAEVAVAARTEAH